MGKHDGAIEFKWEPMPDEYYKARINTLERENLALHKKIEELEKNIGIAEMAMEHQETVCDGISNELNEIIDQKNDEIEVLKGQIRMLKEAIVKGALREVLA